MLLQQVHMSEFSKQTLWGVARQPPNSTTRSELLSGRNRRSQLGLISSFPEPRGILQTFILMCFYNSFLTCLSYDICKEAATSRVPLAGLFLNTILYNL